MDAITQGFTYDQRETALPWSGGWLANSITAERHVIESDISAPCRRLSEDQVLAEQQKKKLFVGMAPKSAYEEDYRAVFAPFGPLVDIYVIRDRNGFSKGCAFVKYESTKSASDATEALHDTHIMPGGFRTLVVTVADERRGPHASPGRDDIGSGELPRGVLRPPSFAGEENDRDGGASMRGSTATSTPVPTSQTSCTIPTAPGISTSLASSISHLFCGGNPPQGTYVYYPYVTPSSDQYSTNPVEKGVKPYHVFTVGSAEGVNKNRSDDAQTGCGLAPVGSLVRAPNYPRSMPEDRYGGGGGGVRDFGSRGVRDFGPIGPEEKGRRWAKQSVGPVGANLFVYYLPGSIADAELATTFAPFGDVLSAKVYYDRDTGESKGFGFVSYTRPEHADAAIAGMNGFFIGHKRLKVVRKRGQKIDRFHDSFYPTGDSGYSIAGDNLFGIWRGDNDDSSSSGGGDGAGSDNTISAVELCNTPVCRSQLELDFLAPQGLLGRSITRFL